MTDGPLWYEHRQFLVKHLRQLGLGKNIMETMILEEFRAFEKLLDEQVHQEIQFSQKVRLKFTVGVIVIIAAVHAQHMPKTRVGESVNNSFERVTAY